MTYRDRITSTQPRHGDPAEQNEFPRSPHEPHQPIEQNVPLLTVSLLGGFQVERADIDRALSGWQRRSAKTLTKLLATCPGHALHREQVLDILWPGVDIDSALNSFGKAIHAARHAFEPDLPRRRDSSYLKLTDAMLALDTAHVVIDADQFEELAENALQSGDIAAYKSALAIYRGDLLPEDRYADWCADRRSFLAELRMRLLLGLAEEHERLGAYSESAACLREVLQQDQTREVVHRHLMRLYAEMGTPDQAVRQFQHCKLVLQRELDIAPQRETVSLYHDVLARRVPHRGQVPRGNRDVGFANGLFPIDTAQEPFVGRERVIQRLYDQLTRGDSGGSGLVLLSGEAGVGKTRLLVEFAARASREGAAVLWGGGGAHANHFACGPFAVALEGYAAGRAEDERNELARRYPALTRLVPSLRLIDQPRTSDTDSHDYYLDLIPAIVRLLTDLSLRQPVLLVIGDLHDADPMSLDLLRYLAQLAMWRQWLMVTAIREEEMETNSEIRRMIDIAVRERLCLKIELRCLSRQGCYRLVRGLLPAVDDDLVEQIYARSGGNPLFIKELVRELAEHHNLTLIRESDHEPESGAAPVPQRLRSLTASQLAAMDETSRRVLGLAASAAAAEISLRDFRAWAAALEPPISDTALFEALDHTLRLRILEERDNGYAFRYPLVRSALFEGLPLHRRAQLHAALASTRRGDYHPQDVDLTG